ncbi:hypothetical protein N7457_003904 [Penicillium paradoxum]|uniref:uncharacterized protein n=1 Tax=Penicillium paradoxum TaxID=176176 RepID=UPI002546F54D|nr:uncharacterized protein N7457_003904 [Penicillium paradoxum]KAJ5782130.1 hypothetical protein N7457_003904 [Penicillium paradoxum]
MPMDHPLSSEDFSIPTHSSASTTLRCCCGRNDCALLEHNNVALEGLEKDLETAARLGQALLHRHESYMAEAEEDRHRLVANIDELECEKQQVQAENARIIEENRSLLEQLNSLNQAVADSDDHVKSLERKLDTAEYELRRLTVAATRAAELEAQLALMETEQSKLQESLASAHEDEKSAVQRWRQAENTLRDLHDQVDRIEKEAREESERHTELVQRMERKRAVERELDNAAGRLKGAAAASELSRNAGGTNVVSRFVKDILQDNANLQVGIMELRDMLQSSNEEVQNLREQVISHQPLAGIDEEETTPSRSSTTLSEELAEKEERRVSQEFHIHHHYHTPTPATKKGKKHTQPSRQKAPPCFGEPGSNALCESLTFSPESHSSLSVVWLLYVHHSVTNLCLYSASLLPPLSHAADSLASSPRSAFRTSSIFDRVERGADFSQATSPESTAFSSPMMSARNLKGLDMSFRPIGDFDNHFQPDDLSAFDDDLYNRQDFSKMGDNVVREPAILEESEPSPSVAYFESQIGEPCTTTEGDIFAIHVQSSSLRRSSSHDSLLSVSVAGMDIHTPTSRHRRMGDWHPGMRIPRRILSPSVELSSTPPVISAPAITADRAKSSEQTSQSLLASMAAAHQNKADTASIASADSASTSTTSTPGPRKSTLSRRVGGWVLGRWGMAPVLSDGDSPDQVQSSNTSVASSPSVSASAVSASAVSASAVSASAVSAPAVSAPKPDPLALRFRHPGVNQKGPIMGLRPPPPAPISIHAQSIDENLLRESLVDQDC